MNLDDVYTWGAIAVIGGPIVAGLSIPVLQWAFLDFRRLAALIAVALLAVYLAFFRGANPKGSLTPTPIKSATKPSR